MGITTVAWVSATLLTPPSDAETLKSFCRRINPGGRGWRPIYTELDREGHAFDTKGVNVPRGILCMLFGCLAVYSVLFATGSFLYGNSINGAVLSAVAIVATGGIVKLRFNNQE